ncbi:MAG: 3-dehydroquinate synthase II, partial [Thermodesulfobacteriota bacterium]|nr:3-dehydroquinate synthase II [Thermodesulfobacteriota bacterium]
AISVVKLKPADEVLGYVEDAGRHFGHKIEETITEK